MWKKIAPLLAVLSIGLNVAFIGAWVVRVAQAKTVTDEMQRGGIWCPLHRELGVTDKQWRQIEPRLIEFRRQAQAIRTDMNRLRAELIDLIATDKPDPQAITAKQEEIRGGQQRMQELVVDRLLAEKAVLTPPQQEQLFSLIRERTQCPGNRLFGGFGNRASSPETQPQSSAEDG